jgi:hypothetical protein
MTPFQPFLLVLHHSSTQLGASTSSSTHVDVLLTTRFGEDWTFGDHCRFGVSSLVPCVSLSIDHRTTLALMSVDQRFRSYNPTERDTSSSFTLYREHGRYSTLVRPTSLKMDTDLWLNTRLG